MAFAEAGMIGGLPDTEPQDCHTATRLGRWAPLQPAIPLALKLSYSQPLHRRCRSAAEGIDCIQAHTLTARQKHAHMMQARDPVLCQHLHLSALRQLCRHRHDDLRLRNDNIQPHVCRQRGGLRDPSWPEEPVVRQPAQGPAKVRGRVCRLKC